MDDAAGDDFMTMDEMGMMEMEDADDKPKEELDGDESETNEWKQKIRK